MTAYDASGNLPPPRRSKYRRPRRPISWFALLLGLAIGIGGGLFYAWGVNPRIEYDTEPWQLTENDRANYIVAIVLEYTHDGDLGRAVQRLVDLRPKADPIQEVADVACRLATTGYVTNNSGLRAVRSLMQFYQLQGRKGCADSLISLTEATREVVIDVPTPTPMPPATKTPVPQTDVKPSPTPPRIVLPTNPPQNDFTMLKAETFCDTEVSGVIEVFVQDFNGEGVPGQAVRVRWDGGDSTFFTGLKPERGPGYADFDMEQGKGYIVEMPGRSNPTTQPLNAVPCNTTDGKGAITSYRVFFRLNG
jgi:hypothetical protein